MADNQRYPERSSSLSAIDFPHGPPNSPSSNMGSPSTAMTLVPDEDIPFISLVSKSDDKMEDDIIDALQRSLSRFEIEEPMVEEFTFEPIDGRVGVGAEDAQLLPPALEIKKVIGSTDVKEIEEDDDVKSDRRVVLHCKNRAGLEEEVTDDNDQIEDDTADIQEIDLSDKDDTSNGEETETDSRSPSPVETPPSAIVRPATPMVPLIFGRKNKNKPIAEPQNDLEQPVASPPRADPTSQKIAIPIAENYKENKLSRAQLVPKKKTFVVAISGCSSAGKSLLAKILSEIFEPSLSLSGNSEGGKVKPTVTIAQDDFFHPKGLQPFVTFTSTPADAPFMEKSIHHDELGM